MPPLETIHVTEAYRDRCEDRVAVIQQDERTIIVVADGAGGIGNGDQAAELVIGEVKSHHQGIDTAAGWTGQLQQIDYRIGAGESTAVVVDLRPDSIIGASVGDSQAWIIHDGELIDLTRQQIRKPLLGSGNAQPQGFSHGPLAGILLVATDGLCNYVKRERLISLISQADFYEIPRRLIELVRLPSGELWDDIGLVVCRLRPPRRKRERYVI